MVNILLTYLNLLNVFVKNEVRWGIFSFFYSKCRIVERQAPLPITSGSFAFVPQHARRPKENRPA